MVSSCGPLTTTPGLFDLIGVNSPPQGYVTSTYKYIQIHTNTRANVANQKKTLISQSSQPLPACGKNMKKQVEKVGILKMKNIYVSIQNKYVKQSFQVTSWSPPQKKATRKNLAYKCIKTLLWAFPPAPRGRLPASHPSDIFASAPGAFGATHLHGCWKRFMGIVFTTGKGKVNKNSL